MPSCCVCQHPQREAIDALLASGGNSLRSIALQFGFKNHMNVVRHRQSHLLKRVERALTKRADAKDDAFLRGIEKDIARAGKGALLGLQAADEGKIEPELAYKMAPAFIQASLRGRELLGQATGRFAAGQTSGATVSINVMIPLQLGQPTQAQSVTIDVPALPPSDLDKCGN